MISQDDGVLVMSAREPGVISAITAATRSTCVKIKNRLLTCVNLKNMFTRKENMQILTVDKYIYTTKETNRISGQMSDVVRLTIF